MFTEKRLVLRKTVNIRSFRLAQFAGCWGFLPRPSKTWTFLESLHGCIHSVSWEEPPTSGESLVRINSSSSVLTERRDMGTSPLGRALNPSMGRLYGNQSLFSG